MLKSLIRAATVAAFAAAGTMSGSAAFADGHATSTWTLDGAASKLAFGSVKKDTIGEVHNFESISGNVAADGTTVLSIDLASIETNIDIRNERFGEHVFKGVTSASLTTQMDLSALQAMDVGATDVIDMEGTLSFLGGSVDVETELFVARLSETQVLVTTNDMLMLETEDLGITAGIDKLMELAKLPGITRVTPVTVRLIFNLDEQKAEAAPAAPVSTDPAPTQVALSGDVDAGKKVFRKCKSCHSVKDGKNGAGPSLFQIVGAQAAEAEGFKFSKAMASSGLTWDTETLSAFLADPKGLVKGTRMGFRGLKKPEDIENVIAYLAAEAK